MIKARAAGAPGQAMVELAVMLPLLLGLLIAVVDFGFLLYAHVQVTQATREGARAGSLYLGGRFYYTSCLSGATCPTGFGDGGTNPACWTLLDWVESALVERNRDSKGCPLTTYNTSVHAFGRLNPAPCALAAPPCWELLPLTSGGVAISGTALPVAGQPLEVSVLYRYNMPFVGNWLGIPLNPVPIPKTVIMKVQNN